MTVSAAYNLLAWDPSKDAGGWRRWSPRDEVAPKLRESGDDGGTLVAGGGGVEYCIGGWERDVRGLEAGQAFAIHAEVECEGLADAPRALWIRVYWAGRLPEGTAPQIASIARSGRGKYAFGERIVVPEGAVGAKVRIIYRWEPKGRAVWRRMSMTPVSSPAAPASTNF